MYDLLKKVENQPVNNGEAYSVTVKIWQAGHNYEGKRIVVDIDGSNDSIDTVTGTALNESLRWLSFQKEIGSKGIRFGQSIDLDIHITGTDGNPLVSFSTGSIQDKFTRNRLKVSMGNPKSMRGFCQRFNAIFAEALRLPEVVRYSDLIQPLSLQAHLQGMEMKARRLSASVN